MIFINYFIVFSPSNLILIYSFSWAFYTWAPDSGDWHKATTAHVIDDK